MFGVDFYVIKRESDGKYLHGLSFYESARVCLSWVDGMDLAFTYTFEQAAAIIHAFYTFGDRKVYIVERFDPEA